MTSAFSQQKHFNMTAKNISHIINVINQLGHVTNDKDVYCNNYINRQWLQIQNHYESAIHVAYLCEIFNGYGKSLLYL